MLPKVIVAIMKAKGRNFSSEVHLTDLTSIGECLTVIGSLEKAKREILKHAEELDGQ